MYREYQCLCQKISSVKSQLAQLPEGNLICKKNGNYYQWMYSVKNKKQYLPKQERSLAEQLALKKYLSLLLQDCLKECKAIQLFLKHYPSRRSSELLLSDSPEIKNLLHASFFSVDEWAASTYQKNLNYPEHLIYDCVSGNKVRSKSESIIDSFLYLNKIPYRYECQLQLGNSVIYPDFTICHPQTKKIYYWEHFGMMSDPAYAKKALNKLQLYISHQIIPSIQLITTYETPEAPLNPSIVEATIMQYFLN